MPRKLALPWSRHPPREPLRGFRFRLYSEDWDQLGVFETMIPNWSEGDEFTRGDGLRFRIAGIVPIPDTVGAFSAYWKVAPLDD